MNKVVRDRKVAVVYSPNFGAGWSTWNSEHAEGLCMDERIVLPVLAGNIAEAKAKAEELFSEAYISRQHLEIAWVPVGALFEVLEYDGAERVQVFDTCNYMKA